MKIRNQIFLGLIYSLVASSVSKGESICGNGIVEDNEECDCGRESECKDPCCRALVCTLKEGAECSNLEPCCKNCKFKRKWEVCRSADNECDLPEFCTGKMGACPPNLFQKDGKNCSQNQGYCSKGYCLTHEAQCKIIFSSRAGVSTASPACYEQLNLEGNEKGHCGNLTACSPENAMCGTLQCVQPQTKTSSDRNDRNQCQTFGTPTPLVQDRTKCDDGKVCLNQRCVNMSNVLDFNGHCPSNDSSLECSGHGDCTNRFTCLCKRGWDSPDCSKVEEPEPISKPASTYPTPRYHDSIPVTRSEPQGVFSVTVDNAGKEDTNYTLGMIFAIAVVTISILFFMCALIYCYLFSSSISKAKESLDSTADAYGMEEPGIRPEQPQPTTQTNHQVETHKIMDLLNEKMDEVTIQCEDNNRITSCHVNNKESSQNADICETENLVNDSKQLKSGTEANKIEVEPVTAKEESTKSSAEATVLPTSTS